MNLLRKKISVGISLILTGVAISLTLMLSPFLQIEENKSVHLNAYEKAVQDSMIITKDEILPLITLSEDDNMVTWNEAKDKILLFTWHTYPDAYIRNSKVQLEWGDVWVFSDKEIKQWHELNRNKITDWHTRLKQLFGLPLEAKKTHVSALWVSPDSVLRPAYNTNIFSKDVTDTFEKNVDVEYKKWFDNKILYSYFYDKYPWTRLGYTYDWAGEGTEYGLSEFIITKNSEVLVEFTYTTEEFLQWLSK